MDEISTLNLFRQALPPMVSELPINLTKSAFTTTILWEHQWISPEPYGNQTDTVSHFCRFQGAESKTNNGRLDAIVVLP